MDGQYLHRNLEETGLLGGTFIILLYLVLIWRGYEISVNAPDTFGKLLAAGVTLWIGIEAFINIGVMVNIVPFAGNALPLISSGGSSLICTLAGIGILMSVSRSSAISFEKERKTPDALIDLRGERGWRISSLAVVQERDKDHSDAILWVGSEKGMEYSLVKHAGLEFSGIAAAGIHGVGWKKLPRNIASLVRGFFDSRRILKDFKTRSTLLYRRLYRHSDGFRRNSYSAADFYSGY